MSIRRKLWLLAVVALSFPVLIGAFTFSTGGCATNGCEDDEQWLYTNANEIADALTVLQNGVIALNSSINTFSGIASGAQADVDALPLRQRSTSYPVDGTDDCGVEGRNDWTVTHATPTSADFCVCSDADADEWFCSRRDQ